MSIMSGSEIIIDVGRLFLPPHQFLTPATVQICDGRFDVLESSGAAVAESGSAGRTRLRFPNGLLLPGLVDLHAHPVTLGSIFGVNADRELLPHGVTTVLSQGDVGALALPAYRASIQEQPAASRIRLALNLSKFGESRTGGCFQSLDDADVDAAVAAVDSARELVWGLSLNVSHFACPQLDPRDVMQRGLEVARRTGRPILYGFRRPEDWPLAEQLQLLRPGDVVTYCFRSQPHCLVRDGHVRPEFWAARERGILFDIGHGRGAFNFAVAETAIADGFFPDTISTDYQAGHVGETPPHTLPLVVSKLIAVGMPEAAAWTAATLTPARILGLDTEVGMQSDWTVLEPTAGSMSDAAGNIRAGSIWQAVLTLRGGVVIDRKPLTVHASPPDGL